MKTIFTVVVYILSLLAIKAQTHPAIERFMSTAHMRGASVSIMIKEIGSDSVVYSYDANREVIPASIIKTITTATALEILGEDFRYETAIMYDGQVNDSILNGNIYIYGSGDPSIGSSNIEADSDNIIREWVAAIKNTGIKKIVGAVIADESIFDTEGISMKWMREDLGSYYGQGCYGLNIYDNRYSLYINTKSPGSKPEIERSKPDMSPILFHNYLTATNTTRDSSYIVGLPYSNERYLYGTIPANRSGYRLSGDIPEPALFLAQHLTKALQKEDITVTGTPTCYRILSQSGMWNKQDRKVIIKTYSLPLKDLARITNHTSSNLYADAILKTIGSGYEGNAITSSFGKGINALKKHWEDKEIETSSLWLFDGSGLAPTDKVTANFMCEFLSYMAKKSTVSKAFIESIPRAGMEGTVANILRGSRLQGHVRLKSGSMSRVRSYAGYVTKDDKQYTVAIIVNNFSCTQTRMRADIEQLLLSLF